MEWKIYASRKKGVNREKQMTVVSRRSGSSYNRKESESHALQDAGKVRFELWRYSLGYPKQGASLKRGMRGEQSIYICPTWWLGHVAGNKKNKWANRKRTGQRRRH